MTTKRSRKSCKHGKPKKPIRTKKGSKRICKKSKRKSMRKNKKSYKMRYDNLSRYDKLELIDRMSIKELLIFSKTNKENNALIKRRIRIIRNDLANNRLTPQEMNDILDNDNFFDFVIDNRINEVRVILKYFPKYINIRDGYGKTPLTIASKSGHPEIVGMLINRGADVNARDKYGNTPLTWASWNGHTEIVQILINRGANMNLQDNNGNTPLMYASKFGYTEIVRLLIEAGADRRGLKTVKRPEKNLS